jgi:hypothetical protein
MCSRAIWLDRGEILSAGAADSVVDLYLQHMTGVEKDRLRQISKQTTETPKIWGSRKIRLSNVTLYDLDGQEQTVFHTGDSLVLQMDYTAREELKSGTGLPFTGRMAPASPAVPWHLRFLWFMEKAR